MGPVFAEVDIDATREEIFDYLMDFNTRPFLYGDSIKDFRLLRLESRGIGSGARWCFKRKSVWADSAIVSVEEPGRISERGVTGKYNKTENGTEWEMSESSSGVTTVRISYWTVPTGMAKMFDRMRGGAGWHRRRLKRAGHLLREAVEAGRKERAEVPVAGGNRHVTGVR